MYSSAKLLGFLDDALRAGHRTALVTIARVIGSSSRAVGTQLAVRDDGVWYGSLSGGCVEAAVVGEALRTLTTGRAEVLRLGLGSPLIDIRLPCGGGLDLHILPDPDHDTILFARQQLAERRPVEILLGPASQLRALVAPPHAASGWRGDILHVRCDPVLRIVVVGHGEETLAMARQAQAFGADVVVLSPDGAIVTEAIAMGADAHLLKTPARSPYLVSDRDTAVIFLFHDHDWEGGLIIQALEQEAFFIGAMGSRRTQMQRMQFLRSRQLDKTRLARMRGPIGLLASTRDPHTLALSVLAEVVDVHRQTRVAAVTGALTDFAMCASPE